MDKKKEHIFCSGFSWVSLCSYIYAMGCHCLGNEINQRWKATQNALVFTVECNTSIHSGFHKVKIGINYGRESRLGVIFGIATQAHKINSST